MTSIAETEPSGTTLDLRAHEPAPSRHFNLRAYLAGAGATTALIAGAIVIFGSLAAYVAFNGLPVGSGSGSAGQLTVNGATASPAAAAFGRAVGAVSATPATASATAPGGATGATPGTPTGGGNPPTEPPATPGAPPVEPIPTPTTGASTTGTGGGSTAGPVSGALNQVSGTTGLPLDDATSGIANTADGALNNVGNAIGAPNLGDTASGAASGAASLLP